YYVPGFPQQLASMFLSAGPSHSPFGPQFAPMKPPGMFPPIQMHNYNSRTLTLVVEDQDDSGKHLEYHHFYGVPPYLTQLPPFNPLWYFPQGSPMLPYPYNPYASFPGLQQQQQPQCAGKDTWPENFTLRGELRWGKL
uniref:Uncharacterized protein n=2 Tax=Latimeria chalumnae TaxID=7897 RepID=H2ZRZ8_LATCH